jgi:hypothetical protein
VALRDYRSYQFRVLVLPVTHCPPDRASLAVEIPAKVKQAIAARRGALVGRAVPMECYLAWPRSAAIARRGRFSLDYGMLPRVDGQCALAAVTDWSIGS